MRSRNQRSWLMTTAQPANSSSAVFQGPQRVDVEVVGRLVEQQDVAAALERLGQVQPVALAARQRADLLLLVGALEVERGHVGARVPCLRPPSVDASRRRRRSPARPCLSASSVVAALIDVGELHRLADPQRAAVGLLLAGDHAEQRGLARAVGTDHAHDAAAGQLERQIVDEQPVAVALAEVIGLDHDVAQAAARAGWRSRASRRARRTACSSICS